MDELNSEDVLDIADLDSNNIIDINVCATVSISSYSSLSSSIAAGWVFDLAGHHHTGQPGAWKRLNNQYIYINIYIYAASLERTLTYLSLSYTIDSHVDGN